ncbi:MAG: hypothetical protein A2174_02535 [Candidatus Portnoybacteria bacterium RBG_13_41_18]|uniref:Putative auto-transporter adhesin head GIN domain-containing protein n=1 Tax=Candidatus Portnoybacteria bacterium RBG_13_41_18 TaxID=1801991 RepID=A0A1G2F9I4_9BACT|nr:MAG: hypothetical protein A2174_02535 [Candidatus Portnoybacteria bacterium RBG_13_41_18]
MEQNTQTPEQNNENPQIEEKPKETINPQSEESSAKHDKVKEIHHHHYHERRGLNFGRFLFGIVILVVGLALLASQAGWTNLQINFNWNIIWPFIIVLIGLSLISFRGWLGGIIGLIITLLVIAFVLMILFGGNALTGSGNIAAEDRAVADFDKISLNGYGNLIITQSPIESQSGSTGQSTSTEALRIEAEDNIMPKIRTRVEDKTLKIDYDWQTWPWFNFKPQKPINFYVTVKTLNKIALSGAGNLKSEGIKSDNLEIIISGAGKADLSVEAQNLNAEISGAGEFLLAGKTDAQKIELSGAAKYDGRNLESKEADVEISGAGQATLKVSEKLNAQISGAGRVDYIGNPQVTQKISGAGKINKLNE